MNKLTTLFTLLALLQINSAKAQDTLVVNTSTVMTSPEWYSENTVFLDSSLITYGIGQGIEPGFMVTVFDTNCQAWDSIPFNSMAASVSVPKSFKFEQENGIHMNELDLLINSYIPNDHPFIIYTPMQYNSAALSPQLMQTFYTHWGLEAIQSDSIMILFGIMGHPNSFEVTTLNSGTQLSYSTVICPHAEQVVSTPELASELNHITAKPNPSNATMTLEFTQEYDFIEVLDLTGQQVLKQKTSGKQLILKNLPDGMYFVVGSKDSERSEPLRIQFN